MYSQRAHLPAKILPIAEWIHPPSEESVAADIRRLVRRLTIKLEVRCGGLQLSAEFPLSRFTAM